MNQDIPQSALRFASPVEMKADQDGARKFSGVAYTGKTIENHPYWGNVVFDLETTKAKKTLPVLLGHDREKIIGQTSRVDINDNIHVDGEFYADIEPGNQVAKLSDKGFRWQMSVHIEPEFVEKVSDRQETLVNGRKFQGPGSVFRNARIKEVSFTPTGWDDDTKAKIMSDEGQNVRVEVKNAQGEFAMSNEEQRIAELEKENTGLKAGNETLEKKLEEAETRFAESEKRNADMAKADRLDKLKTVFQKAGKEIKGDEANIKTYLELSPGAFDFMLKDLDQTARPGSNENSDLFSEQVKDGAGQDNEFEFKNADLVETMSAMPGNLDGEEK